MSFLKFPSTPHLAKPENLDIRDDKVLSVAERKAFLATEVVVEEKVDGANLGISFGEDGAVRLQNRGQYLSEPFSGQWKPLGAWVNQHLDVLFDLLGTRLTLFGEWCYARHSVAYTKLPDWFLAFDVWDSEAEAFWSSWKRDALTRKAGISVVRRLDQGRFTLADLNSFLSESAYADEPAEGLYLRQEKNDWLLKRAKFVRPAFVQEMEEHWSKYGIRKNRLFNVTSGSSFNLHNS